LAREALHDSHPQAHGTPLSTAERAKGRAEIARERRAFVERLVVVALTARLDFPGELAEWPAIVLTTTLAGEAA
jgi:hypothetical protein